MSEEKTISVAKGVFVFKNNFKHTRKRKPVKPRTFNLFSSNLWYQTFVNLKNGLENDIKELNEEVFSTVLMDLVTFIQNSHDKPREEIPTAVLLTGINMPDHEAQFSALCAQIKNTVSPHVACLSSQDCQNIKYLVEHVIDQFINTNKSKEDEEMETLLKKNLFNFSVLRCWYENLYGLDTILRPEKKVLVIIFSDFESFNPNILQKFILIANWYIKTLPFVFIFGIATSINIINTFLPCQVISKISMKLFKAQSSTEYLNNVLENIIFNMDYPFQLGGRVFQYLMDIFLFYDLSVNNFIMNIEYAMTGHFCHGNAMALCDMHKSTVKEIIMNFTHEDLENAREIMSFRKLVEAESYENQIKLLTDDEFFKEILLKHIIEIQKYIRRFHMFLKCLLILVSDLPKAPLGKQLRELYSTAASKNITQTTMYKECMQLLSFLSKEELTTKLNKIISYLSIRIKTNVQTNLKDFLDELKNFVKDVNDINMYDTEEPIETMEIGDQVVSDRKQFKEKLLGMSKQANRQLTQYEAMRKTILEMLSGAFEKYLVEPQSLYFHEIFFCDDLTMILDFVIGPHRSALHHALTDPQYYLQCSCCKISDSSVIKPCMPDICIVYKLHLECGKLINLYDWFQAFLSIVDPSDEEDDSKRVVDAELQARFCEAVAELENLGFIKRSKRKTDHVTRLTWGG